MFNNYIKQFALRCIIYSVDNVKNAKENLLCKKVFTLKLPSFSKKQKTKWRQKNKHWTFKELWRFSFWSFLCSKFQLRTVRMIVYTRTRTIQELKPFLKLQKSLLESSMHFFSPSYLDYWISTKRNENRNAKTLAFLSSFSLQLFLLSF